MNRDPVDEFLRQIDGRTLAGASVASLLLLSLAGLLYCVKPALAEYRKLRASHERAELATVEQASTTSRLIADRRDEVERLRESFYGDAVGVPRRQLESFIVQALDRTATRHAVELLGITPEPSAAIWMFEELPYQVKVKGDYFALHRWLYDVEAELRPMVVKQFELARTRDTDGVTLDLRIVAYRAAAEPSA